MPKPVNSEAMLILNNAVAKFLQVSNTYTFRICYQLIDANVFPMKKNIEKSSLRVVWFG